jgi:hypothetical protein
MESFLTFPFPMRFWLQTNKKLLFKIDVTKCEKCGGEMTKIGSILDRPSIERYLRHVNIDSDPPLRAPPRLVQECLNFDQSSSDQEEEVITYLD